MGSAIQRMGVDLMASVTRKAQGGRVGFRIRFYVEGKLRELYIPEGTKKAERQANIVAQHCEELSKAKANNVAAAADAERWRRWMLARPMAVATVALCGTVGTGR